MMRFMEYTTCEVTGRLRLFGCSPFPFLIAGGRSPSILLNTSRRCRQEEPKVVIDSQKSVLRMGFQQYWPPPFCTGWVCGASFCGIQQPQSVPAPLGGLQPSFRALDGAGNGFAVQPQASGNLAHAESLLVQSQQLSLIGRNRAC